MHISRILNFSSRNGKNGQFLVEKKPRNREILQYYKTQRLKPFDIAISKPQTTKVNQIVKPFQEYFLLEFILMKALKQTNICPKLAKIDQKPRNFRENCHFSPRNEKGLISRFSISRREMCISNYIVHFIFFFFQELQHFLKFLPSKLLENMNLRKQKY